MLERVLRFSIEHRFLVLLLVVVLAALGIYAMQRLPIDAVPDITNKQVQINTLAAALTLIGERPVDVGRSGAWSDFTREAQQSYESTLDVIRRAKDETRYPMAAYNVSGEYAMVKAAAANGWLDERRAVLEILTSIRRAGADLILTYHARDAADLLSA